MLMFSCSKEDGKGGKKYIKKSATLTAETTANHDL